MAATRGNEYSSVWSPVLYLAFEPGWTSWKLGFTTGPGQSPRERTIAAGELKALGEEIVRAKKRFEVPAEAPVLSCCEAGRDGFPGLRLGQAGSIGT